MGAPKINRKEQVHHTDCGSYATVADGVLPVGKLAIYFRAHMDLVRDLLPDLRGAYSAIEIEYSVLNAFPICASGMDSPCGSGFAD